MYNSHKKAPLYQEDMYYYKGTYTYPKQELPD